MKKNEKSKVIIYGEPVSCALFWWQCC